MAQHLRKPDWLKIRLGGNEQFTKTKSIVESHCLHTICTSGKCPNMGECWSRGTATFMIGGEICTRSCRFCNTLTGKPLPLDPKEPANVAESIRLMNLKHAVITSVDRDDLPVLATTPRSAIRRKTDKLTSYFAALRTCGLIRRTVSILWEIISGAASTT